ncbi:MAG: Hpt domain-containing protein [Pseudomonas sp.]|nr:Hpt domain-containing protein [Pseudomonas sp.]
MSSKTDSEIKKGIQIKTKLRLTLALSSLGLAFMCALGIIGMNRALTTITYLGETKLQAALNVGQMQGSLLKLGGINKAVLEYKDVPGEYRLFEGLKADRDDVLLDLKEAWERYEKLPKDEEEQQLWASLVDSSKLWEKADKKLDAPLIELSARHDKATHEKLMFQYEGFLRDIKTGETYMTDGVSGLYRYLSEASVKASNDAIAVVEQSKKQMIGLAAGIILFSLLFGILMSRSIHKPLTRMIEAIGDIEKNDDFSRRVEVQTHDEIGVTIVAFNGMIAKIEASSAQLRQKTNDIQTMLQNMPQGILTIVDGGLIHSEYSAYLETILETDKIAGRQVMDLLFANSNLGADTLSQVEAVGGACIGEDIMNFEFNSHLMVTEFEKTMADGRVKSLELSWSAITDDNDMIVSLMLCVRDVTELRKLAAEAGEQKRELEIIGEILAVNQEKFHEFISGSTQFVEENQALIKNTDTLQTDVISQLFRNMHTIKGNARTYALQHLTNVVHEAEQTYDDLRQNPELEWNQTALLEQLQSVADLLAKYEKINEVTLGRKGPGRRGSVERYLMVDKEHIHDTLLQLESANMSSMHDLVEAHKAVRRTLRLLGTEHIGETLDGVFESLPSLAAELGKEAPVISIEEHGYVVRGQVSGILKNVFMHLLRNSMDHGLEAAEVRTAKGKSAAGNIKLELGSEGGQFTIRLGDDGKGLALGRIRRIALEKNMLPNGEQSSDEEVAKVIFQAGFSTAEAVTEVSGRGVGMDAVQDFVAREGGSIHFEFVDNAEGADFRQFQTVVSLPDKFAVHIEA